MLLQKILTDNKTEKFIRFGVVKRLLLFLLPKKSSTRTVKRFSSQVSNNRWLPMKKIILKNFDLYTI